MWIIKVPEIYEEFLKQIFWNIRELIFRMNQTQRSKDLEEWLQHSTQWLLPVTEMSLVHIPFWLIPFLVFQYQVLVSSGPTFTNLLTWRTLISQRFKTHVSGPLSWPAGIWEFGMLSTFSDHGGSSLVRRRLLNLYLEENKISIMCWKICFKWV